MKKRNPNDATLRNTRAANRRLTRLEAIVKLLLLDTKLLHRKVRRLEEKPWRTT